MLKCWAQDPSNRPSFSDLGSQLLAIYAVLPKTKATETKFSDPQNFNVQIIYN